LREHGPYRADDLDLLEGWRERLTAELASVRSQLGEGPLHGDAHPGNVLRTPSGLVLVDFEHAAWGIREWDLVPFALRHRRLGGSPVEYASFATGYGHDLAGQEHWETLARVRELGMTTWRMLIDASSSVRAESHRRIAYWRGEPTGRWRAF
jgi:Ser/Thr protein kinase RdoA (MazF antagonist)